MAAAATDGRAGTGSEPDSPEVGRVAAAFGAAATLSALGGIALGVLLDPTFSWTTDALSDLGVRGGSATAFNWGLIVGGAAGVCYAGCVGRAGRPLRALLLALAMVAMAGVGVFDLTEPLHGPAAIGFYGLITLVFAVDGWVRRGEATGRVALGFTPVHLGVWATFAAGWWPVTGLALPELPGALMLAAWVWAVGPAPVVEAIRSPLRDPTDGH
ncbi:DUF998 domain-containing protein [Halorubrum distributum]|uniref:DUF998 domain-containing protein n=1 Tax=Halorubrum distributum TaxID=29283 RepID=UPI002955A9B1|nr:DUF998 domain-containing protein [Halorubrum distributum]MDV7350860.1 DUF998 domain-containing protein [Halorubrum distributum]